MPKNKIAKGLCLLIILTSLVVYFWPRNEEYLYSGILDGSKLRYEVYSTHAFFDIMPGSAYGGPGVLVVFNSDNAVVFRRKISSTYSEFTLNGDELNISGEGSWRLRNIK
jgi:hypothetical protein